MNNFTQVISVDQNGQERHYTISNDSNWVVKLQRYIDFLRFEGHLIRDDHLVLIMGKNEFIPDGTEWAGPVLRESECKKIFGGG